MCHGVVLVYACRHRKVGRVMLCPKARRPDNYHGCLPSIMYSLFGSEPSRTCNTIGTAREYVGEPCLACRDRLVSHATPYPYRTESMAWTPPARSPEPAIVQAPVAAVLAQIKPHKVRVRVGDGGAVTESADRRQRAATAATANNQPLSSAPSMSASAHPSHPRPPAAVHSVSKLRRVRSMSSSTRSSGSTRSTGSSRSSGSPISTRSTRPIRSGSTPRTTHSTDLAHGTGAPPLTSPSTAATTNAVKQVTATTDTLSKSLQKQSLALVGTATPSTTTLRARVAADKLGLSAETTAGHHRNRSSLAARTLLALRSPIAALQSEESLVCRDARQIERGLA